MPKIVLRVIPDPAAGTVALIVSSVTPVFRGGGDTDYLCGSCGVVLMEGVTPGQIADVVLRCPTCGLCNQVEPPRPSKTEPIH